jgi:signal transduction histidine kinase
VIFVVTGAAGYFLAGRTLRPIKEMVDEQRRFITDASHELRTPLTSLRSEIEVGLRNASLSEKEARALLQSNLEEVISLQLLSDNLLALTQNGREKALVMEDVSLSQSLKEAEKRLNGNLKKKKITVKTDVPDDLTVRGVRESIVSLLVILLDNAVKYSPSKSTISLSAKRSEGHSEITLVDQGIGIEKEDLPHVFERFYRANKSRSKEQVSGYGLGLSIAKKIVTSHKGTIHVTSEVDKGTTFVLKLPTK